MNLFMLLQDHRPEIETLASSGIQILTEMCGVFYRKLRVLAATKLHFDVFHRPLGRYVAPQRPLAQGNSPESFACPRD